MGDDVPDFNADTRYRRCPHCAGEYAVGKSEGEDVVAHTLPPCREYVRLGADEFLDGILAMGLPS